MKKLKHFFSTITKYFWKGGKAGGRHNNFLDKKCTSSPDVTIAFFETFISFPDGIGIQDSPFNFLEHVF